MHGLSTIKDEVKKLRIALDNHSSYTSREAHDPFRLFLDRSILVGGAICFPEYTSYMLETDPGEAVLRISSAISVKSAVGNLEMIWTPLGGLPEEYSGSRSMPEVPMIYQSSELLGQPWTYRVDIKRCWGLPFMCSSAYIQYEFYGDTYITEQVSVMAGCHSFVFSSSSLLVVWW